jgi:cytochrome c peroxidase
VEWGLAVPMVPPRGLNVQRLFGSQRALKTVEAFTEFEQRTAYFDGDIVAATKKGVNPLERCSQVDFIGDFQEMLDFPLAPKLDVFGKLDPAKASQAELRGQEVFFGKGQCASCHQPPFYTDNLMHDLQTERFFKPVMINNMMAIGDGPIKTFALRRQGQPAIFARWASSDTRRHGRVLQPDPWNQAAITRKTRPRGVFTRFITCKARS